MKHLSKAILLVASATSLSFSQDLPSVVCGISGGTQSNQRGYLLPSSGVVRALDCVQIQ